MTDTSALTPGIGITRKYLDQGSSTHSELVTSEQRVYPTIATGELAGATSATQLPNVSCKLVKLKAAASNTGKVYLGGSGVTVPDGTTDTTTGYELSAGEETGWLPIGNLNLLYRIANNAGDDLTYLALS